MAKVKVNFLNVHERKVVCNVQTIGYATQACEDGAPQNGKGNEVVAEEKGRAELKKQRQRRFKCLLRHQQSMHLIA